LWRNGDIFPVDVPDDGRGRYLQAAAEDISERKTIGDRAESAERWHAAQVVEALTIVWMCFSERIGAVKKISGKKC